MIVHGGIIVKLLIFGEKLVGKPFGSPKYARKLTKVHPIMGAQSPIFMMLFFVVEGISLFREHLSKVILWHLFSLIGIVYIVLSLIEISKQGREVVMN